jgi:formate dehydrogenase maturation protein FdhE
MGGSKKPPIFIKDTIMGNLLEWWREFWICGLGVYAIISNRREKKANAAKDEAIAAQEKIKVQKEDVLLSQLIQETYQRLNKDVFERLNSLEKSNDDLLKKYNDILLRNGILEEKAEAYEQKYETLKRDYGKLKLDYDKVHKENKEIRKELDELKNAT